MSSVSRSSTHSAIVILRMPRATATIAFYKNLVVEIARQIADEKAVDLHRVGLQVLEIGERRKSRAEIIEAGTTAGLAQRLGQEADRIHAGDGDHAARLGEAGDTAQQVDRVELPRQHAFTQHDVEALFGLELLHQRLLDGCDHRLDGRRFQ